MHEQNENFNKDRKYKKVLPDKKYQRAEVQELSWNIICAAEASTWELSWNIQ